MYNIYCNKILIFIGIVLSTTAIVAEGQGLSCNFSNICQFTSVAADVFSTWKAGDIRTHNISHLVHTPIPNNKDLNVLFYPEQRHLPFPFDHLLAEATSQKLHLSGDVSISFLYYTNLVNSSVRDHRFTLFTKAEAKTLYDPLNYPGFVHNQWTYFNLTTYFNPGYYTLVFSCMLHHPQEVCAIKYLEIKNLNNDPVVQKPSQLNKEPKKSQSDEIQLHNDVTILKSEETVLPQYSDNVLECKFDDGNCHFMQSCSGNTSWHIGNMADHNLSRMINITLPNNRSPNAMFYPDQTRLSHQLTSKGVAMSTPPFRLGNYTTLSVLYFVKSLNSEYPHRFGISLHNKDDPKRSISLRSDFPRNRWVYHNLTTVYHPATYTIDFEATVDSTREVVALSYILIANNHN